MPTSHTAVQYLIPYSCHFKLIKTQTSNIGLTWTRSGIDLSLRDSWICRCWCTARRYVKSGKSGSGRPSGHTSLIHLARSTLWMLLVISVVSCIPVFPFELESMKTNWTLFGHWHRPIWCQANLCAKSPWQLEQSRHSWLVWVFRSQSLGHEYKFPDENGLAPWFRIEVPSLTASATDLPMACTWSFNLSSSSIRVSSSAADFSHWSQFLRDLSNHLEYHPEVSREYDATTAWNWVEEVPLQATPEGPRSCLDNQWQIRELCCCQHTFVAPVRL